MKGAAELGCGERGSSLAVTGDKGISHFGGRLLLTVRASGHEAASEFCCGPGVALGVPGDCGGAELARGEGLTAAGARDVGVAELAGGGLSRACQRNDNGRGGFVLVCSKQGEGAGKKDG